MQSPASTVFIRLSRTALRAASAASASAALSFPDATAADATARKRAGSWRGAILDIKTERLATASLLERLHEIRRQGVGEVDAGLNFLRGLRVKAAMMHERAGRF